MLNDFLEYHNAGRVIDVEERQSKKSIKGDFEGSVTGTWVGYDFETNGGIVRYNDKEYLTKVLGIRSIKKGTKVQLSFADGIYYSDY